MKKSGFFHSLPFKLLASVVIDILIGLGLNSTDGSAFTKSILNIVVTLKYILNQLISFCIPLIIIGFIAPSITKMGNNASKLLLLAVAIAYTSSLGAALFSADAGYALIPVFLEVIVIVLIGHFIWMALLYGIAGAYSGENPFEVIKHYGPAYLTAVGTMSSAATLAVALQCAGKAKPLRKDMISFGIPLFANIHLCGSVLTEVFFCMTVSKILYGSIPSVGTMILFCLLLGVFAIGAPGVPGGTVMASLGLITGVLGFNDAGTALMLTIFALQDSFGTACNVTGDGALTLILSGYAKRHKL